MAGRLLAGSTQLWAEQLAELVEQHEAAGIIIMIVFYLPHARHMVYIISFNPAPTSQARYS